MVEMFGSDKVIFPFLGFESSHTPVKINFYFKLLTVPFPFALPSLRSPLNYIHSSIKFIEHSPSGIPLWKLPKNKIFLGS